MKSAFDLTGAYALVTGGAGMLGTEFCKTLASAGARVACFDRRPFPEPLPGVESFRVDTTDSDSLDGAFAASASRGIPSILVNCVGLDAPPDASNRLNGPFEEYEEAAWDSMIASHLKSAFLVSRRIVDYAVHSDLTASIINVSSIYGVVAPDQAVYQYRREQGEAFYKPAAYTVAKAGLIGFTKWLAEYGGSHGVRANTLVLGGVWAGQDPRFVAEYEKRTMLGRMAKPGDFNGALLFLASDASRYMTGAELVIDGGWTAR